jgi:hypothetical protein
LQGDTLGDALRLVPALRGALEQCNGRLRDVREWAEESATEPGAGSGHYQQKKSWFLIAAMREMRRVAPPSVRSRFHSVSANTGDFLGASCSGPIARDPDRVPELQLPPAISMSQSIPRKCRMCMAPY